jgi:hypothetical protein
MHLNYDWLKNKQSKEFIRFENMLSFRYANYGGLLNKFESAIKEIKILECEIIKELTKEELY